MMFGILYGATDTAFAEDQGSGAPLIDGFLLVQGRQSDGTYADVTLEWLNLGIARENTNTAILKFQSLLDDSPLDGVADIPATAANLRVPTNFYPFNLYDSREGEVRDVSGPTTCALGGIMNIVELDVDNLRKWLAGLIGTTGNQVESVSQNGYLLYFSDRRGMLPPNLVDPIVGEYGYEDLINPTDAAAMPNPAGVPNGLLDPAEDVNQNGIFDTYGADNLGDGFGVGNGDPTLRVGCIADVPGLQARINRVSGARHALKLANGTTTALPSGLPTPGFTVGSENPVYVQGDYNANGAFGDPHVPAAIIADSVTFLSNNWEDWRSFANPTDPSQRAATATWFRVAVATGKNIPWANPTWSSNLHDGMDGGVRYLIRSLEQWPSGQAFNYRGSLASLYYSQYGVGVFKCCTAVFSIADLNFSFDTDFLNPTQMPPATPRLQDVVSLGFRQLFTAN